MSFHNQEPFSIKSEIMDKANISTPKISKDLKWRDSASQTHGGAALGKEKNPSLLHLIITWLVFVPL